MTRKEFLDKIESFLNNRLSVYGEPSMQDDKRTPYDDLCQIKRMISEFKKISIVEDSRIHPNSIAKLSNRKTIQKEIEQKKKLEKELLKWHICPRCGGNLNVIWAKFYEFWKHTWTYTCEDCKFSHKKWREAATDSLE